MPSGFPPAFVQLVNQCLRQDPSQRPTSREALDALISIDASAHANGPLQLYPMGYAVPAASTLLSVLSAAMPNPAQKPLLQLIIQRVESLARGAQFTSEITTHGLTLLEAHCICAYSCDAREFGGAREESPFYMCVPGFAPFIRARDTRLAADITRLCVRAISKPLRDGKTFRCCLDQVSASCLGLNQNPWIERSE
jgi:hypothetical protein